MDEYKLISLIKRKTGKQYKSISCIDWDEIISYKFLSDFFVNLLKVNEYFDIIIKEKPISYDFIRLYKDKLDWNIICRKQILYEEFIRENKEYVK